MAHSGLDMRYIRPSGNLRVFADHELKTNMKVKTYFYAALLLPLIGAAVCYPLASLSKVFAIPVVAIMVGGVPYLAFAFAMLVAIKKAESLSKLFFLVWFSPFLYLPFLIPIILVYVYLSEGGLPGLADAAVPVMILALFTMVVGYCYAGLFSLGYLLIPFSDIDDYKRGHGNSVKPTLGASEVG